MWHFTGYLYGTECACPTRRWSVFPPSFKFSGCLITMYSGLFVGYRVYRFSRAFSIFCNFITMDMFSNGVFVGIRVVIVVEEGGPFREVFVWYGVFRVFLFFFCYLIVYFSISRSFFLPGVCVEASSSCLPV